MRVQSIRAALLSVLLLCTACTDFSLRPSQSDRPAIASMSGSRLPGYIVKRQSGAKRALILVHGITGDGTSSWTSSNGIYWPSLMKDDPVFEDFDVYVYQYPTSLLGQCLAITDIANNMRIHLKNDAVFDHHEQIVFLAHSMGGIVVRQFLLRNRDTVDRVPLVMFFATPTAGSWKANAARFLPTCSQVDDLQPLDINSYLKSQQSDWLSSGLQERVISYCAFETQGVSGSQTVDRSSATLLCTKDPESLPTNHSDAVKPKSQDELAHIIVRNALKDLPSPNIPRLDPLQENHELKKQVGILKGLLDQRFRNRGIREQLGRFITEGNALLATVFKGPPAPLPEKQANDWYSRARRYLREYLDSSYEARFLAPDPGLPMSYGLPKEYEKLISGIRMRLAALRHFAQEIHD